MLSYEEIYRCGYNLVIHKWGERLYNGVKELIEQYLESEAKTKVVPVLGIADTSPAEGVQVLKVMQKLWKHHVTCLLMMSDILVHMVIKYLTCRHKDKYVSELDTDDLHINKPHCPFFNLGQELGVAKQTAENI